MFHLMTRSGLSVERKKILRSNSFTSVACESLQRGRRRIPLQYNFDIKKFGSWSLSPIELQLAGEATRVHNNNNTRKVFVILQEREKKKTQGKVFDEGR